MIKLLVVSRRLSGLTRREYFRHLQCVHAPKILNGPADLLANLDRYVQNHVIDGAYGALDAPMVPAIEMDSISEIYNPDMPAVGRLTSHPYHAAVIKPDEDLFADISTVKLMMAVEEDEPVSQPRNGGAKLVHFIRIVDGVDPEAFFAAWRTASRELVADAVLAPALCRYVRSHALPVPRDATGKILGGAAVNLYSGAASLWFDRADDMAGIDRYRERFEAAFPASDGLVDHAQSMFLIVQEIELYA